MGEQMIILSAAGAVAAYIVLRWRISVLVQPVRLRIADMGESILASDEVDRATKSRVLFLMESLFSWRTAWMLALLFIPATISAVWKRHRGIAAPKPKLSADIQDKINHINAVALFVIASNSPLALLLLMFQVFFTFQPVTKTSKLAFEYTDAIFTKTDRMVHGQSPRC